MHTKHYQSVQGLYRDCEPFAREHAEGDWKWNLGNVKDWLGVEKPEDVFDYAKTGWPDGIRQAREALNVLAMPRVASYRRQKRKGDFGDFVDMQAVYTGNLATAWTRTVRNPDSAHRQLAPVTIMVSIGTSWKREQAQLFWRGAAAAILADAIQQAGRSVQIIAYEYGRDNFREKTEGEKTLITVQVKTSDAPLDLPGVAYQTALAGFFRVWIFSAIDRMAETKDLKVGAGYGHPLHTPPKDDDIRHLTGGGPVVWIEGLWNQAEAQAWLDKETKALTA